MSVTVGEGDLLSDCFRCETFLGEGGVSTVWLGHDERSDEQVVIKFPNYESKNDPRIVKESIEREIEILESIEEIGGHPNLMRLVARTSKNGHPAMVVEYVSGEELFSAVKRRNGFTNPEDVRTVGIDLCEAMSFLHEHEIIYRDLKPDNVILRSDLTPVLIDFNTAKGFVTETEGADRSGTVIPNPTYKPPELNNDPALVGFRQGPWSDVYSIGKVLMFMFSASAAQGDGVDPRDFPGTRSVPTDLAMTIKRATQAHKDDRYRNATVLARVLANRSPEPPEVAEVTLVRGDATHDIYPGDTVGRAASEGPQPSISLEDPDTYISAVHAQFNVDDDGSWLLRDRSLNGSWLRRGDDWHQLMSPRGRRHRNAQGGDAPDASVPEEMRLEPDDLVALVHPTYDVVLTFDGPRSP